MAYDLVCKPPAIMAGWIDRVIVAGVAYRLDTGDGEPEPLQHQQRLVVLNTTDTSPGREAAVLGDPRDAGWRRCVGTYLCAPTVDRLIADPMASSTSQDRQRWLEAVTRLVADSRGEGDQANATGGR
jgi:NAD(P)H dehydrogenase (quinone)